MCFYFVFCIFEPAFGSLDIPIHFSLHLSFLQSLSALPPFLPLRGLPITGSLCCLHNGAFCCPGKYTHTHWRERGKRMVGAHCSSLITLSQTSAHLIILFFVKLVGGWFKTCVSGLISLFHLTLAHPQNTHTKTQMPRMLWVPSVCTDQCWLTSGLTLAYG